MNYTTVENKTVKEKYYFAKHKSGLNIYVIPKDFQSSYALFSTKYGAVDNCFKLEGEEDFTRVPDGIAHFLEHKMFENEDGTDTFARFAEFGGDANAFTSSKITAYLFSCTDNFKENLDILLDYVSKPYFTPETVQKEQGIIGQEIRMGEDNPRRALYYNMLRALYSDSQIKINVAGTVESISEITADLLYKCYYTFYNLSNMTLCVCGSVTMEEVIEAADRILPLRESKSIIRSYNTEAPAVAQKRIKAEFEIAKPLFGIGIKDTEISPDADARMHKQAALDILSDVLFGETSRFYIDTYESGIINGLSTGFSHNIVASYGEVFGESAEPETVYEKFVEYIEEIKKSGIPREDFENIKRADFAAYVKSFDSTNRIAEAFTFTNLDGGDYFKYGDELASVTYEECTALLNSIFTEEHYAMSVCEPIKK